jgi:hypothetical protein
MTAIDAEAAPSAWSWWEGRRLTYNLALFITGWVGFGLQAAALTLWSTVPTDLAYLALWQGLIYVFYMAAANVLYLLGAVVEAILKPRPVDAYRRHAWIMGTGLAVVLPVVVATVVSIGIGWPANVG